MENGKKLEFLEGQEGVRGNQGFPLGEILSSIVSAFPDPYIRYIFFT
jgi:hypothetical protein